MDRLELLKALWFILPRHSYATGGEVDPRKFAMPASLRVEGAGDLALPLSGDGFLKLKAVSEQAPYGKGEQTLLDTDVRRAWQVDASKVSCPQIPDFFSKVVLDLAVPAMAEMGIDAAALGLDVRLYKLLLYEEGGHFKFHRDTEKEHGMFATMILQLPTQSGYQGGELEVRHGKKSVTFDFSGGDSSTKYFQTAFFCDCEHRLAEVKGGTRACLVFSLVRTNTRFVDVDEHSVPAFISALSRVQSLLRLWASEADDAPMLAIPLGHMYSKNSLSFAGLKGHDRVVAALVLSCASFLDVHLCMLVRHTTKNEVVDNFEEEFFLEDWKTMEDERAELESCTINIEKNVLQYRTSGSDDCPMDPFDEDDDDPDEETHEQYTGNDGGNTDSFYRTAALVVWPKGMNLDVLSSTQAVRAWTAWLVKFEAKWTRTSFQRCMPAVLSQDQGSDALARLLKVCAKYDFREEAFSVMKKWNDKTCSWQKNKAAFKAMALAIEKFGWDDCYKVAIQGVMDACPGPLTGFSCYLAERGLPDAAVALAKMILNKLGAGKGSEGKALEALLDVFVKLGLEEEALSTLSIAATQPYCYDFDPSCLVRLVKGWGESRSFPHVEAFWDRKFGAQSKRFENRDRRKFMNSVASFALELESAGCHDMALAFAKKLYVKDVGLEELYHGDRCDGVDLVVVLCHSPDERLHEMVLEKVANYEIKDVVITLRNAAGLIGLKEDNKVRELFGRAVVRAVDEFRLRWDVWDALLWLRDEKLMTSVLDMVRQDEKGRLGRNVEVFIVNKENIVDRILAWDVARNGVKKVLEARVNQHPREEEEGEGEERGLKRQKLGNPRLLRYNEKLEIVRTLLARFT